MRTVGFISGVLGFLAVFLVIPTHVFATAENEDLKQYCLKKLNITIRKGEIHFIFEKEHDPQLFLVRRCISAERKKLVGERQVATQRIRDTARFRKSSENTQELRNEVEGQVNKAIRRKHLKSEQFRAPTHTFASDTVYAEKRSRRTLIREVEGTDRINAIRRKMMKENLPDPCASVTVVNQNTTCGVQMRYHNLKKTGTPQWYRRTAD